MKFSELQRLQRREGITVLSADERIEQLEARLRAVTKERDEFKRACFAHISDNALMQAKIAEMERQEPVMWANSSNINSSRINRERGGCGDQHTCSETQTTYHDTQLYALPGAQDVPKEAIAKILTEVMDIAVSNGADSRSMPDEYVEVAAWLCGIPAQPAPSVPEGWKLVPIEPTPMMKTAGIGVEVYQDSPPSTDCLTWEEVEAIYKAMLAAAPEVKK